MPTLAEATQPIDESLYERVPASPAASLTPPPFVNPDQLYSIKSNTNLRSPAPPISVSPDNLRQYYKGGQAPQYRVLSPPTLSQQAQISTGGGTTTTAVVTSGSSSSTTVFKSPTAQTVGISTPALTVGQIYQTVVQIAKAFDVLAFGVNAPARIRLYKTQAFQVLDASRPTAQMVPIGTQNGIICDMLLQQPNEFSWKCSPDFPGSNADSPQTTSIYLTITNVGASSSIINLTILYVPVES